MQKSYKPNRYKLINRFIWSGSLQSETWTSKRADVVFCELDIVQIFAIQFWDRFSHAAGAQNQKSDEHLH